ncbi:hypothetical protein [Aquamicrobium soli]|jgi:hypothetical protein|uniref:Uncharacterized protein n=1 Tax=Aquamicrobium soli TaxID=1811518 RepID=A0ABV7K3V8_9HYPH
MSIAENGSAMLIGGLNAQYRVDADINFDLGNGDKDRQLFRLVQRRS